ncbi:hypothetical protein ACWEWX_49545, partial [Streptomyces asiaticus]
LDCIPLLVKNLEHSQAQHGALVEAVLDGDSAAGRPSLAAARAAVDTKYSELEATPASPSSSASPAQQSTTAARSPVSSSLVSMPSRSTYT